MNAWHRLAPFFRKIVPSKGAITSNAAASAQRNSPYGIGDGGRAVGTTGTGTQSTLPKQAESNNHPLESGKVELPATAGTLQSVNGVRGLPRPALRWVGAAGRIALR